MYADELTDSMEKAISETNRRREIQMQYNKEHNIVPKTISKSVRDTIKATVLEDVSSEYNIKQDENIEEIITKLHMKKNLAEVVRLKLDDQELAVIHNPSRGS